MKVLFQFSPNENFKLAYNEYKDPKNKSQDTNKGHKEQIPSTRFQTGLVIGVLNLRFVCILFLGD